MRARACVSMKQKNVSVVLQYFFQVLGLLIAPKNKISSRNSYLKTRTLIEIQTKTHEMISVHILRH